MIFCKECHSQQIDGRAFCTNCGEILDLKLPPAPLVSKVIAFDVLAECRDCTVQKYVNEKSRRCFACHTIHEGVSRGR